MVQSIQNDSLNDLLNECLTLTYNAMVYGKENSVANRKGMKLFYRAIKDIELPSCYKMGVITRACAALASRTKSDKRRVETRYRKPLKRMVCINSGFFVTMKGRLFIPLRKRNEYVNVLLNSHLREMIAGKELRSLTITPDALSLCYSEEIEPKPMRTVYGVDRNEKNLTFGNAESVVQVDMAETTRIRQTTREIVKSFRRNDVRIRKRLASKYWKRANHRTGQILHAVTNFMVDMAARNSAAFALEDLTGIRKMYRKSRGQGTDYRFRMNSWPYLKAAKMLKYKSEWKGMTVIQLTKSETYGSSSKCPACGEKLRSPLKGDVEHQRMLWCQSYETWTDRDVIATLNLSKRGLARFASSLPQSAGRSQQVVLLSGDKGLAGEAVRGNPTKTAILRVDASKLSGGLGPAPDGIVHGPST